MWTDTMYICHYINPLLARLLSLADNTEQMESMEDLVAEPLRLGAGIYLATIRYAFGITPFQPGVHVQKIRDLLKRIERREKLTMLNSTAPDQELDRQWVRIWLMGCAAIGGPVGEHGTWACHRLRLEMEMQGMESWEDFEAYVGFFLWIPEVHGVLLRRTECQHTMT